MLAQKEQDYRDGDSEWTQDQAFHYLAEDDEDEQAFGGLESPGLTERCEEFGGRGSKSLL